MAAARWREAPQRASQSIRRASAKRVAHVSLLSRVQTTSEPLKIREALSLFGELLQQACGPPILTVRFFEFAHAIVDFFQSDAIRIPHRPAAMSGKAIAGKIDNVDIDGTKGETFLQDSRTFIDERVDAAPDDFLRRDWALFDSLLTAPIAHEFRNFRVRNLTSLVVVAIPACTRLLAKSSHLAQFIFGEWLPDTRLFEMAMLLANAPADIESREIGYRERAHCHSEVVQRAVNRFDACAFFDQKLRFAAVGMKHAIADESAAISHEHTDLAE